LSSLLAKAKAVKVTPRNYHRWEESLTPKEHKEYIEFLQWYKQGVSGVDRPVCHEVRKMISEHFGRSINRDTFAKHLRELV